MRNINFDIGFARENPEAIHWVNVCISANLSEEIIEEFQNYVSWPNISVHQILSERFIRKFYNKVKWFYISKYQNLSEGFIREFKDYVDWNNISLDQKLSEDFIREFKDKVNWYDISWRQKLSEDFIREFKDEVDWLNISTNQKLSEDFIREFKDKVHWSWISWKQKLSEGFIREFKDKVDWFYISRYQKLNESFVKEFGLEIPETCWLYKSKEYKKAYIKRMTNYEIVDDMLIAYKSTKKDGTSVFDLHYKYEVGKEYKSNADYNISISDSNGLSAWTKEGALKYYSKGKLFKVGIKIEDIAAIVLNLGKIRATKIRVLEEINPCINNTEAMQINKRKVS